MVKEVIFVDGGRHQSPIPEAVKADGYVFLSAVRGVNPASGNVDDDTALGQSRQLFANMREVLEAAGSSMQDVVKVAVFMMDLEDRGPFNEAWREAFPVDPPARFAVQVADMGQPGDKTRILCEVTALARS